MTVTNQRSTLPVSLENHAIAVAIRRISGLLEAIRPALQLIRGPRASRREAASLATMRVCSRFLVSVPHVCPGSTSGLFGWFRSGSGTGWGETGDVKSAISVPALYTPRYALQERKRW